MTLQSFFQIPLVKFGIHVLLVAGFFVNIFYFYRNWEMQQRIQDEQKTLSILQQENNDSRNQRDYFTSDLYRDKFAKEENFKKRGETVVDTSVLEPNNLSEGSNYIPEQKIDDQSNVQRWWSYFFGRQNG